ncbi:MAG: TetR/AcrR family transcriptional regulator [Actinomycetota bacterium]
MSERGAARRMRGPDRREQILATARRRFARTGYENTSLDDIAAAAGITKPVLYRHFAGKSDLYLAVLDEHLAELIRRLWVALSAAPEPQDRLRDGLKAYFQFVEERADGFRMLVEAGARNDPDTQARLGTAWDTLADGIARTVGDLLRGAGLDPAGAPIYARALIGMTQSVADWWLRTKRVPRENLVDYLLALAWRGFDGLPRDPTHRQVAS